MPTSSTTGSGPYDAETLFRTKPIPTIRTIESQTRHQIESKKEELRQLIGNRYRDLIDSADSILSMKSSCTSLSSNISSIHSSLLSLNHTPPGDSSLPPVHPNPNRSKIYGIASRVKYLVDTPENIWGCLDEYMFLEASVRYVRAKLVYNGLKTNFHKREIKNFPLLSHQWQIVESFKSQISQRAREKLSLVSLGVDISAFADALAGVAVIDELGPTDVLALFLESRKSWILQRLASGAHEDAVSVLCEVTRIIEVTVGQVGEMFLQVLSDMPLFYKVVLGTPPAAQLFGGIPNPEEEVRVWGEFRERLESVMVVLDREFVARSCSRWLRECGGEIVRRKKGGNGKGCLVDVISSGGELAKAEKRIREVIDSKEVLEGSLEWLKSVFGSDVELPWSRTRELVLEESVDLWDEIFEDAFVDRMKMVIDDGFEDLSRRVNVGESVSGVGGGFGEKGEFGAYLNRVSADGGVWFVDPNVKRGGLVVANVKGLTEEFDFGSCLSAYFGPEASRIRDAVDNWCRIVLEDVLCFLESPKASLRLNHLAPYLQSKCYESMSRILGDLKSELDKLHGALDEINKGRESQAPPAAVIERSLFIGRLLFAFQNHSKHIPVVLGSPRYWLNEALVPVSEKLPSLSKYSRLSLDSDSLGKHVFGNSKRQKSLAANALFGANDITSPKLDELIGSMKDLCVAAHGLWISWVSDELAKILAEDLSRDDGLSAKAPSRGWEEIVVKEDQSSGSGSEMKILLPSMPSLYIVSYLFRACEEVHRVGGHVLDKTILRRFAKRLLEKVIGIYNDLVTNGAEISEKGALQVLLDLRFAADILSGCDSNVNEGLSKTTSTKSSFRRKQDKNATKSAIREHIDNLLNRFSQRLDPIDWQTFESHLWENERESYLRHAVLFGFFVQLNRLYTNTALKPPSNNSESNIMRCSTVPRFKYLPISAPALSSRAATKSPIRTSSDDVSARSALEAYANGDFSQKIDFGDSLSIGAATPIFQSFMQVGRGFGESTFKLGSMLTDARFKDKAAAMSSFSDILPLQAAGLLSSFTATRSDS